MKNLRKYAILLSIVKNNSVLYLLLFLILLISGCATVQDRIAQVEQRGIEKTYDCTYDKVFYACEDVFPRMNWAIEKSNFEEGYISSLTNQFFQFDYALVKITKIDKNKTLVKILGFGTPTKRNIYKAFFYHLDTLLSRK
ncbi:MAG TPA: hypothetical protein PLC32_07185 [Candidatus Omnitrophota bacterium]|nr:hypothetical protein [Candidatus Omnitrophota bacterium]